jgi:hypothetical protein
MRRVLKLSDVCIAAVRAVVAGRNFSMLIVSSSRSVGLVFLLNDNDADRYFIFDGYLITSDAISCPECSEDVGAAPLWMNGPIRKVRLRESISTFNFLCYTKGLLR